MYFASFNVLGAAQQSMKICNKLDHNLAKEMSEARYYALPAV
jgi:hypothetical protein